MSRIASTLLDGESQFKRRKVSISDPFLRKLKKRSARKVFNKGRNGKLNRVKPFAVRKPLKKIAKARRTELQKYFALTTEFLLKPENHLCEICRVRREKGENIRQNASSEVHHWGSRNGRLLCYVPWFRASCRSCREWPHANPRLAREYGLLAPPAVWNVYPD